MSGGESEKAMSKFCDPAEGTGATPKMTSDNSHAYTMAMKHHTVFSLHPKMPALTKVDCITGSSAKKGKEWQDKDRLEDPAHPRTCRQCYQIAQLDEDDGVWVDTDSLHVEI